ATLDTPEALAEAVRRYTVFGRVTPSQKQELIHAMKADGRTVGMVGDGINDVLAMRASDCSAAMASGSEAAAQIAQLVLLESDFSRMPAIVDEGRRIVNHIARSASLFLIKNIFSFLLAAFSLIFWYPYPLQPSQLSLVSLFTIGIPSFLLAMEPNRRKITGDFLPAVLRNAVPSAVTAFLCAAFLVLYGDEVHLPSELLSTVCTLVTAFVGFAALWQVSTPINTRRGAIFAAMLSGFAGCIFGLHRLFALEPLNLACRLLTVMVCLAALTIRRFAEWITMHGRGLGRKKR
ncbi:MAG: HAD-IC family P-type ATPase, partial [Clostridia bacterium]|nr:HAD-IC family P-type ATPase [Clostridia bacterium]